MVAFEAAWAAMLWRTSEGLRRQPSRGAMLCAYVDGRLGLVSIRLNRIYEAEQLADSTEQDSYSCQ
jgi:hypothetical protein